MSSAEPGSLVSDHPSSVADSYPVGLLVVVVVSVPSARSRMISPALSEVAVALVAASSPSTSDFSSSKLLLVVVDSSGEGGIT